MASIHSFITNTKQKNGIALLEDILITKLQQRYLIEHLIHLSVKDSKAVLIVCLETSPRYFAELIKKNFPNNIPSFGLLDCYSNPIGWNPTSQPTQHYVFKKYGIRTVECTNITNIKALKDSLHQLISEQHVEPGKDALLIIDTITPLLKRYDVTQVARLVQSLVNVASASNFKLTQLCGLHVDTLSSDVVGSMEYVSDTVFRLEPTEKESEVAVHCSIIHKHTGGRLSTGEEKYQLSKDNRLEEIMLDKKESSKEKKTKKDADPTANLTFNLKLTDEEKKAKENVVLPYTHHLHKDSNQQQVEEEEEFLEEEEDDLDDDLDV